MGVGLALAAVALVATAASTYVSYQGQQYNAAVAKNTAEYNSKVQENQAIQADMEARETIARQRAQNRRFMSSQRAAIAKSGIAEAGSPLEVLGETAGQLELQAQDQARAARLRLSSGLSQSANTLTEGLAQSKGYKMAATGTLISGAAKMASQAGSFSYNGNFGGSG
jgi:hypothetical protein